MNEHFKKAASAVKAIESKGKGMFNALLAFAHDHRTNGADALREHFKAQEKLASVEMKVEMTKNSTYKVAKGKLVKAVELGIELVDTDGKPIGKTALEEKIKEVEGTADESEKETKAVLVPAQEFAELILAASKSADKLADTDITTACAQVSDLYKKLADRLPMAKAA